MAMCSLFILQAPTIQMAWQPYALCSRAASRFFYAGETFKAGSMYRLGDLDGG
jgi:hypothetical protein